MSLWASYAERVVSKNGDFELRQRVRVKSIMQVLCLGSLSSLLLHRFAGMLELLDCPKPRKDRMIVTSFMISRLQRI